MIKALCKRGIEGLRVAVEAEVLPKGAGFGIVGLAGRAVRESAARVESAIRKSDFDWPRGKKTVNLSPADEPKEGISLDLPIALALLEASGQISVPNSDDWVCIGGLSLEGKLARLNGALAMCSVLRGGEKLLGPKANERELGFARLMPRLMDSFITAADDLNEAAEIVSEGQEPTLVRPDKIRPAIEKGRDFRTIVGQNAPRFALEVAAAGGHNVLMVGPPGFGKTSLAQAMVTILPKLSEQEQIELTSIYGAVGKLETDGDVVLYRPFVPVHHTASLAGLVGGGQGLAKPGSITLAHKGVLFLDEINRFDSKTLEALRQPIEDGSISLARSYGSLRYPCQLTLVAAMNPCACGNFGEYECMKCGAGIAGSEETECPSCGSNRLKDLCSCSEWMRVRFREQVSPPLMDRIDIEVGVHSVAANERLKRKLREGSASIRKRVERARRLQAERFAGTEIPCNAFIPGGEEAEYCEMTKSAQALFEGLIRTMGTKFSIRRERKLLKVARTIADLADRKRIGERHIVEAARLVGRDVGAIIRKLAPHLYRSATGRLTDDEIARGIRDLKKGLD